MKNNYPTDNKTVGKAHKTMCAFYFLTKINLKYMSQKTFVNVIYHRDSHKKLMCIE